MDFEKQKAIHRQLLLSSPINFASKMFAYINKRPFVVGKHHYLISDALEKVVRGETQKLIVNISPRYGKCLHPNTKISTSSGLVDACRIKPGDLLLSYDNGKPCYKECVAVGKAYKPSVRIDMDSERFFICSEDHPMLTNHGYVSAACLHRGEQIVCIDKGAEEFGLDYVLSVTPVGNLELIDIQVADTHNFVGNGLVSHNTELISRMFIAYGFALNPASKYLHISYSGNLVSDNSMAVKDVINSEYFQNCFDCHIRRNDNTRAKWSTTAGGGEYATSTLGQITGFGAGQPDPTEEELRNIDEFTATFNPGHFAGAIVIDDPLRPDDALSDVVRETVNRRFETTIRNRVNSRKTPIIIVMQRLHEHDLCGYLQEIEPNEWEVLSIPVISTNEKGEEEALWPYKHTLEELYKIKNASDFVFETQYMQNPTPQEGLMYRPFRTYDFLPPRHQAKFRGNYTDSADTGADFLCSIDFDVHEDGYYVTDVLYTKKPMEYTEQAMAQMVTKDKTDVAWVESNNGGRTFMRNVERITRSYENRKTQFIGFSQTRNKQMRIYTMSGEVNNMIVFPSNWEKRWPDFAHGVKSFRKEGINAHDDHCFVAGTMVRTIFGDKPIESINVGDYVITPFGVRRVLESGCTGEKEVVTHLGLTATPDHHVFNGREFCELQYCKKDELSEYSLKEQLLWHYRKLLCSMKSNTDLWGRENIILVSRKATKNGSMLKDFMSRSGSFIMGKQYRKAIVFTTRMAILSTTVLTTWSVCRLANICRSMQRRISRILSMPRGIGKPSTESEARLANGTEARKGESGTDNMQKTWTCRIKSLFVRIAERLSIQSSRTRSSVVTNAERDIEQKTSDILECVSNVEKNSDMESGSQVRQTGSSAAIRVQQPITTSIEKVYNIKVDKDGCFYANGILVSNCDALTGVVEKAGSWSKGATDQQLMNDFL